MSLVVKSLNIMDANINGFTVPEAVIVPLHVYIAIIILGLTYSAHKHLHLQTDTYVLY